MTADDKEADALRKLPCTWGRPRLCFHTSAPLRSQGSGTERRVQPLQPAHPGACTRLRVTPRPVPTCSHSLEGCERCRKSKLPHGVPAAAPQPRGRGNQLCSPANATRVPAAPQPALPAHVSELFGEAAQCPCPRSAASRCPVCAALTAGHGTASYSRPQRTSDRLPLFPASCLVSPSKHSSLQQPCVPEPER